MFGGWRDLEHTKNVCLIEIVKLSSKLWYRPQRQDEPYMQKARYCKIDSGVGGKFERHS